MVTVSTATTPVGSRSYDRSIAAVAGGQNGLITTAQLRQIGLADSTISKRAQRGVLHRRHRAVWAVGHPGLSQDATWHAAVLAVGSDAALSHIAAAALWNIWRRRVQRIDVTSPTRHRPVPGIHVHLSRGLRRSDVCRRRRIPVTSVARTILDLGDVLTPFQLANVIHEAQFRNLFDREQLERLLVRYRGRRAVTIVRRALMLVDGGSAGTFSDLEDLFLAQAHARGLDPLVNVPLDVHDGEPIRPDFRWPERMLIVEVDGGGHDRKRTKAEDRGREARFTRAGWSVLRCPPDAIARVLDEVEHRLGPHADRSPRPEVVQFPVP